MSFAPRSIVCLALVVAVTHVAAFDRLLDRRAFEEAIQIGMTRMDATRGRFHAQYRVEVGTAPVDYVELITPFRRVVLAAEARLRAGNHGFGLQDAKDALEPNPDDLTVYVEVTFHPLNTFVGVPEYGVLIEPVGRRDRAVLPREIQRVPRYGARVEGYPTPFPNPGVILPHGSQPLTGGTLIARFDGAPLDAQGIYDILVTDGAQIIGRARADLARVR